MPVRLLGILFVALLFMPGCSDSLQERQKILSVLATRAGSLNARNISQYISVVSPRYNDKGKNFAQLKESLEKSFQDFEQISYVADTPSITVKGTRAESVCSYRMKAKVRGKEMTLNGTEHLRLVKEPEGWKIIAGL